jgi:hypothetical protein
VVDSHENITQDPGIANGPNVMRKD